MINYDTFEELRDLSKQIKGAQKEINALDASAYDHPSQAEQNNAILKERLPKKIEITAELASFLAHDEMAHDKRTEDLDKVAKPLRRFFSILAHAQSTVFLGIGFDGLVRDIAKQIIFTKEYNALMEKRDKIAGRILTNYLLKQNKEGDYILKLADYTNFEYSVGKSTSRDPVGLHDSVDLDDLPELPDSLRVPGRGSNRSR